MTVLRMVALVVTLAWACCTPVFADEEDKERWLPLFSDWFEEQDVDLPLPYGVGLNLIYMNRSVEVDDVRVAFGNRPPESVSDTADFDVDNSTGVIMARADAWILPFVNVYLLGGRTRSEARMTVDISIPVPGPGGPIQEVVEVDSDVEGNMIGAGLTAVIGYGDWFGMFDANYSKADLDAFNGDLEVGLYSGRFGRLLNRGSNQWMFWGGALYMDSERTIQIISDLPIIGTTEIQVDQRPTDPLTWQLGASVSVDKRWVFLAEVGVNAERDIITVLNAAYRF